MKAVIIPNDALCSRKAEPHYGFLHKHKATCKQQMQDTIE